MESLFEAHLRNQPWGTKYDHDLKGQTKLKRHALNQNISPLGVEYEMYTNIINNIN